MLCMDLSLPDKFETTSYQQNIKNTPKAFENGTIHHYQRKTIRNTKLVYAVI